MGISTKSSRLDLLHFVVKNRLDIIFDLFLRKKVSNMEYDFEAPLLEKLKTVLPKNKRKVMIRNDSKINGSEV